MLEDSKRVSALKARTHLGEIIDDVRYEKIPYIIERNGRPVAAIIDIEVFRRMVNKEVESSYIEDYTEERTKEFLTEDQLNNNLKRRLKSAIS